MNDKNFKIKIGLEIHVQLKTKSKMFCACDNQAYNRAPNTVVCPVCMGMPGVLPVANKLAVTFAVKSALALGCTINPISKFDRKHYFYPDLPKGYQISQYDLPIGVSGKINYYQEENQTLKESSVRIRRVHLEEDAGKLIHRGRESLVDLNRAGTPLLEIVTEPDLTNIDETKSFLQILRLTMRHLEVSEADMEKGHLRCDANINLEIKFKGKQVFTPLVEIKNLNSFRAVEAALIYETKRQSEQFEKDHLVLEFGNKSTRGWDEKSGTTKAQRVKEEEEDYRYFPEPDLPSIVFDQKFIEEIKNELPVSIQQELKKLLEEYKFSYRDAQALLADYKNFEHFRKVIALGADPKKTARIILNKYPQFKSQYKIYDFEEFGIKPKYTKFASELIFKFSNLVEQEILEEMFSTKADPEFILHEKGYTMKTEKEIEEMAKELIAANPKAVADYRQGKSQVLGYLVGQVMNRTKGRSDPKQVKQILEELLK